MIDQDAVDCIDAAMQMADHGLMPAAGGTWDQSAVFLAAARFVTNERNYWKAAKGIED